MLKKPSIYNTLAKKKEVIKPMKGKKIRLFVCGPTVYDFLHIGNARVYVVFDSFVKFLKQYGFSVFYLQNITDIDDKIIMRAKERGVPPHELANVFAQEYLHEMKRLGVDAVNKYAKATDYIKEIISQVKRLQEKEYTYQLPDGIYFDIAKFKRYGQLSGRTALQADDAVSRIDYAKDKRNRGDFCLWKFTENQEQEPSWPSPWGNGRPGWHIEDTAITEKVFGPQYEIHGAAIDLIFPHHEAEITQMEAISGKRPLAKYWMHTGFLTLKDQKMAKSAGGMITIKDFLNRYKAQHLRFLLIKSHWRSPLDYSESTMIEIKAALEKIEEFLRKITNPKLPATDKSKVQVKKVSEDFYNALADDFNTPQALGVLFDFMRETNKLLDQGLLGKKTARKIYAFFKEINQVFGIIDFKQLSHPAVPHEVMNLLQKREEKRKGQQWKEADELRKEITKYGYEIEDTAQGPALKRISYQ